MVDTAATSYGDVIERYVEGFNESNPNALSEVATEDIVVHGLFGVEGDVHGIGEYGEWAASMMQGIPDATITIDKYFEADDKVGVRWTVSGTHGGELFGIPPTEETFEISGLAILRMEDGQIAEKWYQQDDLGMLQQTGIVEAFDRD